MFTLSPIKILVIVAVILIVLGPDKLPEVARQIGTAWRSLRSLQQKIENEVREVVPDLPTSSDIARFARSPVNLLNSLADKVAEPLTLDTSADEVEEDETEELTVDDFRSAPPTPYVPSPPPVRTAQAAPNDPSLN